MLLVLRHPNQATHSASHKHSGRLAKWKRATMQGWRLCFPRPKSRFSGFIRTVVFQTWTCQEILGRNVPVGCTNLYLHSLHCALNVASACVPMVPREKSTGRCKSMLCSQWLIKSCLLETQDAVLVIPGQPDWNRLARCFELVRSFESKVSIDLTILTENRCG